VGAGGGVYAFDTGLTLVNTTGTGKKAKTAYDDIFHGP